MPGAKRETLVVERIPLQFRLDPKSEFEAGRFSGIASVFGSIVDTYPNRTRFREGAFLKTINDRSSRVKILSQHDDRATWIGLPTKLQETKEGLYLEASLNKTSLGLDVAEAMKHAAALGKLDAVEFSIGFDALNCDMVEDEEDKEMFREVTEARLWEVSVVNFGADRQTRAIDVEIASRQDLERALMPKQNRESFVVWSLQTLKSFREGAAPAPLTEAQRKQITEELALHAPAEPPKPSALTDYEIERQLSAIALAEAEIAFAEVT